uniref:Protein kinase domain-containing protein n=1 Tax=Plectus sambesii TaxID=2011161 RepID=A0A914XDG6_9BILA
MKNFVDGIVRYSGKRRRTIYKSEVDGNWASLYEQRRAESIVTTSDLLSFAYQIANGMEFLHNKEVVHRDLALRNIFLAFDYIVKIGDFGLSRRTINGLYQKCQNPRLPLKWTAPEVFVDKNVPIESDLYTFGILLWELFTLGAMPHEQFIFVQELEEEEVNVVAKKGKRMDKPPFAPKEIYELMKLLCNLDPYLRPPLKQCKRNILKNLKEACPPLASRFEVADALAEPDRNVPSHGATANEVHTEMSTSSASAKKEYCGTLNISRPSHANNKNTSNNENSIELRELSALASSKKTSLNKDPPSLNDDIDIQVHSWMTIQPNRTNKKYRRNIIIFIGLIFALAAIATAIFIVAKRISQCFRFILNI